MYLFVHFYIAYFKFFGHKLEEFFRRNILKFGNLKSIARAQICRHIYNPTTKFHVPKYKQQILRTLFFNVCIICNYASCNSHKSEIH
jgi:hypothetical protein